MLHHFGSLWGVSSISAASLFRCCTYPVFLSTMEVLLKSALPSNTAELSGSLRHKFLLLLFVPGLNCPWFALHVSQHVDVFVGQDVACANVLLASSLLILSVIDYLYSSIVRLVSSTCCRCGFCWGARVVHDAVVAVSILCEGVYVLTFPIRTQYFKSSLCVRQL